jgi:hypothetical protein
MSKGRLQDEVDPFEKTPGLTMSDVLDLPDPLRDIINWMIRGKEVDFAQVTARLGNDERAARQMLDALLEKGYIREIDVNGQSHYRVRLALKHK